MSSDKIDGQELSSTTVPTGYSEGPDVYQCKCAICSQTFEGPKREVACPACQTRTSEDQCVHGTKPGDCDVCVNTIRGSEPQSPDTAAAAPEKQEQPPSRKEILAQSAATANVMIEEIRKMIEFLKASAPSEQRDRRIAESERLIRNIEATRAGVVDLRPFLSNQPSDSDFGFPTRINVLATAARHRLAKSKFYFPDPRVVVEAAAALWSDEKSRDELKLRIVHYLSKMSAAQDGLPVSAACRRIIEAAAIEDKVRRGDQVDPDQIELATAARAALHAFMSEARLVRR